MNSNTLSELIIFGAGGHSKVLIDLVSLSDNKIIGVVDPKLNPGNLFLGISVYSEQELFNQWEIGEIGILNGVGGMPNNTNRPNLTKKLNKMGYIMTSVVHKTAFVSHNSIISDGVQIMAGAILQPNVYVGKDTIINTSVSIDHDCHIGQYCHIAPGSTLSGNVVIGDNCHIGTGTVVVNNVTIGKNSVIGAGSVVYKDIPNNTKLIQSK